MKPPREARSSARSSARGEEDRDSLLSQGRQSGIELAGYRLGPRMIADMAEAALPEAGKLRDIPQGSLGGGALWLRAEPDHDPRQADALAAIVSMDLIA